MTTPCKHQFIDVDEHNICFKCSKKFNRCSDCRQWITSEKHDRSLSDCCEESLGEISITHQSKTPDGRHKLFIAHIK